MMTIDGKHRRWIVAVVAAAEATNGYSTRRAHRNAGQSTVVPRMRARTYSRSRPQTQAGSLSAQRSRLQEGIIRSVTNAPIDVNTISSKDRQYSRKYRYILVLTASDPEQSWWLIWVLYPKKYKKIGTKFRIFIVWWSKLSNVSWKLMKPWIHCIELIIQWSGFTI